MSGKATVSDAMLGSAGREFQATADREVSGAVLVIFCVCQTRMTSCRLLATDETVTQSYANPFNLRLYNIIEVFKICNGLSRIRLNELFTLDDNIKGTRGH